MIAPRYSFFVSYARSDGDELMSRLVRDLAEELGVRTGPKALVYFYEANSVRARDWSSVEYEALQESRTLLALYSPNYFVSQRCGREFAAFFGNPTRFILPVFWIAPLKVPPLANQIQYLDSAMPEMYRREGLRYFMRLRRYSAAYEETVHLLAIHLARVEREGPQYLNSLSSLDDIESAFSQYGSVSPAGAVGFAFLVPTSADLARPDRRYGSLAGDWRPFGSDSVAQISQRAAAELGLRYEEIPLDDRFPATVSEWSRAQAPIVVVVDPSADRIQRLRKPLDLLENLPTGNVVVVSTGPAPHVVNYLAMDQEGLYFIISKAVTEIRLAIIKRSGADLPASGALPNLSQGGADSASRK
jgi:hypothetical protein